jgi:hypothetical protein
VLADEGRPPIVENFDDLLLTHDTHIRVRGIQFSGEAVCLSFRRSSNSPTMAVLDVADSPVIR